MCRETSLAALVFLLDIQEQRDERGHVSLRVGDPHLVEIGAGDTVDHTPQLPDASVRDLSVDAVGSIWVATSGGLARWSEGSWRRYSRREGLPSNVVWAVHADSRGVIWVGTYGAGAARLEGERFRPLNSSHGLPSNVVRQILDDGAGKTARRGLSPF